MGIVDYKKKRVYKPKKENESKLNTYLKNKIKNGKFNKLG